MMLIVQMGADGQHARSIMKDNPTLCEHFINAIEEEWSKYSNYLYNKLED